MSSQCANPLLLQWIKEWYDVAKERSSKGVTTYKKAYDSMKACPLTFNHPSEAQQLHGLGSKLCDRLTEKLEAHCSENGLPMPKVSRKSHKRLSADDLSTLHPEPPAKKTRKAKPYVPSLRSGPYALILTLSSLPEDQSAGLTKAQLIERAQEHCDSSFTAPVDTSKFYTAWNSMKTLVDKDLVYEKGRPLRRYYLSDEGWEVAKRIQNVQGVRQALQTVRPSDASVHFPGALSSVDELEFNQFESDVDGSENSALFQTARPLHGDSRAIRVLGGVNSGRQSGRAAEDHPGAPVPSYNEKSPSSGDPKSGCECIEILSCTEAESGPGEGAVGPIHNLEGRAFRKKASNSPLHEIKEINEIRGFPNIRPIRLQPGTFAVQLVLDSREVRAKNDRDYIQEELAKQGVNALVRPLELGDFFWVAKCKEPGLLGRLGEEGDEVALDWIIERKRLDDLVESIKDGRFQEQKFRFRKLGISNVVYIIEEFTMSSERISHFHEAIESAIGSTQVVDGYFVKKTTKLDDTIRYLARMTGMMKSLYESKPLYIIPSSQFQAETYLPLLAHLRVKAPDISHNITYASFCALASKTDSLTLRDIFLKMLMCTRGVTGEKALEIQKCWTTPRAFIEALEGCEASKGREALLETKLGGKVGRKKLGKAVGAKVAEIWGEA